VNKAVIPVIIILAVGVPTAYAITITLGGDPVIINGILNMMGNKITNVADPTLSGDAATKQYVDSVVSTGTPGPIDADTLDGIDSADFLTEAEHNVIPDADTLASLGCMNNQIAKFVGSVWTCVADSGLSCTNERAIHAVISDFLVSLSCLLPGELFFATSAGGTSSENGLGITTLSDNSIVVTGLYSGTATFGAGEAGSTILTSAGSDDVFVAKYNPDGTLAFAKSAGGTGFERGSDITTLSDNSVVVTGHYSGTATFGAGEAGVTTLTTAGQKDIFVAKYNPDGTLAFAKSASGTSENSGHSITTLSDNSVVVTGEYRGITTFGAGEAGSTTLTSAGDLDFFVAKYNPDGTLAFAKSASGTTNEAGFGITTLSDDSVVVTGQYDGIATFGAGEAGVTILTTAGGFDVFVAKYNPDGTLAFAKSAGGTTDESDQGFLGITALSDDSVVVTGEYSGTATFGAGEAGVTTLISAGGFEVFVAKYNPDGTLAFAKSAGGTGSDFGSDITALSDNSIVITGTYSGTATFGAGEAGVTTLISAGSFDIFVAKYNPDGTLAFAKSVGGTGFDRGNDITTLSDKSVVVTGQYASTATFGAGDARSTTLISAGFQDIFVAKYKTS